MGLKDLLQRIKESFGLIPEEVPPPPDPLEQAMQSTLNAVDQLSSTIKSGWWKGRRPEWRTKTLQSVHQDVFHLIAAIRITTDAIITSSKPPQETRLSRRWADNLTTCTLDAYLVDEEGLSVLPHVAMEELIKATHDMISNLKEYKNKDAGRYDYYLRQCSHIFVEIEIITKTYL